VTLLPENALSSLRNLAGLASLYHELGYPTDKSVTFTPEDAGLERAAALVKRATLLMDLEGEGLLLQHWHFELNEPLTTASIRRVTEDFLNRTGEYLLSFSSSPDHYASVQFVKPRRETQEGGKNVVRLSKLTVVPSHPTGHDLSVLRAIAIKPGTSAKAADDKQREAFSVERVTKRFFETYARLFRHVREVIRAENPNVVIQTSPKRHIQPKPVSTETLTDTQIDNEKALHAFTQRLLGRLLFLYFIQKKGWLGGEAQYITTLYKQTLERGGNFYRDALEPLYFETLSTPDPRGADLPDERQIPYLNGSLFEREYPDQ
jgi:adenine-specific DNA-methyltransferase